MILTEDLTKKFNDFLAVDGVSLNVPDGQALVLLGPNGAGKTTTVRMLTSILRPTRGRALVAGFDVVREPEKVRAAVGVLTEHHGLYGRMNAFEYLDFYGDLYGLEQGFRRKRINDLLDKFGLGDAQKKRLGEFSKGMRQKLALTRALLHEPKVLLLDEPTSAMDPESARTVRDAILQLRSGERTILLCTHNLTEAEELADQIVIIRHGKILYNGSVAAIKKQLLGAVEYEAVLADPLNGRTPPVPSGATLTGSVENGATATKLRFHIEDPRLTSPILLRLLLENGFNVISFQEIPRSLEDAYLRAVSSEAFPQAPAAQPGKESTL